MPPVRRHVDPGSIAGWLVHTVEHHVDWPDDLLARLTGTTRSRITAARIAALDRRGVPAASRGVPDGAIGATTPRGEGQAA